MGIVRFSLAWAKNSALPLFLKNLAALTAFAAYWICLPPAVSWWDTAEAQAVPYLAGIFHPTGFPAYAIAGWFFTHLFVFGNVAWRMSLFSAMATAFAVGILTHNSRRLGSSWSVATVSSLLFASAPIIWQHSTRAGDNTFELLTAALAIHFALSGRIVLTSLFVAVALASHPVSMWLIPGIILVVISNVKSQQRLFRTLALAALAFGAGMALYLYLPIRSAIVTATNLDPTRNLPIEFHPIWDYDHPSTVAGFIRLVSGADFNAVDSLANVVHLTSYPAYIGAFCATLIGQYSWIGFALALVGVISFRANWLVGVGLLTVAFGVFPFSASYWTLDDPGKYSLVALWVTALLIARGAWFVEMLFNNIHKPMPYLSAALLVLVANNVAHSGGFLSQRNDKSADGIIESVRKYTPDGAIISASWYYATPLFYAAYVDHSLGHRLIVTNVEHSEMPKLAASHQLFYIPIPSNDIKIDGVKVEKVMGAWPDTYRIESIPFR